MRGVAWLYAVQLCDRIFGGSVVAGCLRAPARNPERFTGNVSTCRGLSEILNAAELLQPG